MPLVGRHEELERVGAILAARERLPAGILFHGPPGIGKTALWGETVRRSRSQGFRVLECALSRNESRLTFAGLADLIGPVLDEVLPALAPARARALETALAIGSSEASIPDERAVAFGLHGALAVLASRSPIALAVDDLQWLDPSSMLMLSYAIRRLRQEPVLLVLAQRDDEALDGRISLTPGTGVEPERILVGPLPLGAIHRIIRTRSGASLTRPQLLRIHGASEGNPLHALELARAITSEGAKAPDALSTLLANRLAALPEGARQALALIGIAAESDIDSLALAYGPHLREDLQPGIDAGLVTVASDRIRFTHPLIALAAERSVSETRRGELHHLLARATPSEDVRAAHLAQATREPDAGVAVIVERAAQATHRRGARAASAELFEAAARLTPTDDPPRFAARRLAAAAVWYEAGDSRRAEDLLTTLRAELPDGDQRCEAGWRLGILLDEAGRWQEATALWQQALTETADPGLTSQIQCSLAVTSFYTAKVRDAVTWASAAATTAEASVDPAHLAHALSVFALTLVMNGLASHQVVIERALALETHLDDPLGDLSPSGVAAECARHSGDVEAARVRYQVVLERAQAAGDANVEQWAAFGLAQTELLAGRYRQASELADVVLDMADQTDHMRIPARSLRAHVDAHLGDLDGARSLLAGAIEGARTAGESTHLFNSKVVLGAVEALSGNLNAAARAYMEARDIAVDVGLRHATALRSFLNEAEVAGAAGLVTQAEAAIAAFDTAIDGDPPPWSVSISQRAAASIHAAHGDLPAARRALENAVEDAAALPIDRGRSLLAMGTLYRRIREFSRARGALQQAVEIFGALGTPPLITHAQIELQRIPGRRSGDATALTEAEKRIAELVAVGRSNKDVASTLFVSVKTVEVTLTRVYGKLGVRSRAELAHRFGEVVKGK